MAANFNNGPINESRIKVTFKNAEWMASENTKNTTCLLLISVGQEAHEGERFSSTVKLINRFFGQCIISLYDSLQRYTIALATGEPPEHHHHDAAREGDHWLERNKKFIDQFTIPHHVVRWDYWLNHPNFFKKKQCIIQAMKEDPTYHQAFEKTIETYLTRYQKRTTNILNFDDQEARNICLEYLLEECTVLCLWLDLRCEFEIYPNSHNLAMEATRTKFLLPYFPNLLRSVNLRFRNAKQLEPQKFVCLE